MKVEDLVSGTIVCDCRFFDLDEQCYVDYSEKISNYFIVQISADSDYLTKEPFVLVDIASSLEKEFEEI